jgi:hypothetical protein
MLKGDSGRLPRARCCFVSKWSSSALIETNVIGLLNLIAVNLGVKGRALSAGLAS